MSERVPLSAVRSVDVNENGETILMGRSSNTSHFQLSANRHISRVHVKVRYVAAPQPTEPNKMEVICNGWNGLKLHCQGRTWDLAKGDTFTSVTEGAEIMVDVQDARVLLQWPKKGRDGREREPLGNLSDSSWDESPSRSRPGPAANLLHRSPLRRTTRIASPESPTPASRPATALQELMPGANDPGATVQIYEDSSSDEQELPRLPSAADPDSDGATQDNQAADSFSSELSDPQSDEDPDEENDPIVHSFGPFGANLSNRLASFTTKSPLVQHVSRFSSGGPAAASADNEPTSEGGSSGSEKQKSGSTTPRVIEAEQPAASPLSLVDKATIANHVINQLAFSRLSSNPLTGILNNLPTEEKKGLTKEALQTILESTTCIGVIPREGKDAAGKVLESEYYYVPETDTDENRRLAVTDGLRKPSLRNCRKQHKVSQMLGTVAVFPIFTSTHPPAYCAHINRLRSNTIGNVLGRPKYLLPCYSDHTGLRETPSESSIFRVYIGTAATVGPCSVFKPPTNPVPLAGVRIAFGVFFAFPPLYSRSPSTTSLVDSMSFFSFLFLIPAFGYLENTTEMFYGVKKGQGYVIAPGRNEKKKGGPKSQRGGR